MTLIFCAVEFLCALSILCARELGVEMRTEMDWAGRLERIFREAVPSAVILRRGEGGEGPDLRIKAGSRSLLVGLALVRGPRIAAVEGQMARSVLKLSKLAGKQGGIPVVVVALDRFGSKLAAAVRGFMEEFVPGVGWGLMDERGQSVLEIPALDLSWARQAAREDGGGAVAERGDRQLFTDLNCWMLKVLLLGKAPPEFWGGPRRQPRHATELADLSRVSVAKAHTFVKAFEARGFLRRSRQGLMLVSVQEMLESWLQDEKNATPKSLPVRALVPLQSPDDGSGAGPPLPPTAAEAVALGGVHAALCLGLMRVAGRPLPLVHVRIPFNQALGEWQLEGCELRDAQMIISRPLRPQSVFRGRIERADGLPLVDLWQIALDSVSTGARGAEQAEYILERVLALQVSG